MRRPKTDSWARGMLTVISAVVLACVAGCAETVVGPVSPGTKFAGDKAAPDERSSVRLETPADGKATSMPKTALDLDREFDGGSGIVVQVLSRVAAGIGAYQWIPSLDVFFDTVLCLVFGSAPTVGAGPSDPPTGLRPSSPVAFEPQQ